MFDEYSIEGRATQIFDARTKEYFAEVLSSYNAGNYRSSVVMLWSVAVCDLLFKLQHLVDLYGDTKAKAILADIGKLQKDNERSPVWETRLVDSVAEQTQLLDIAERDNLLHLQRQRHLSAHPVITANLELHRPNRDTARALIRNTLDELLTKAPILSTQVFNSLIEDLEENTPILLDDRKLKRFLDSKYFDRFTPEVEKAVFRSLWKLVFRLTDPRCESNRIINYSALRLLHARNPAQFRALIEAERDYFSTISSASSPITCLIHFISKNAALFDGLTEPAKLAIQHAAETHPTARCYAWFLSGSLQEHARRLAEWISGRDRPEIDSDTWDAMKELADSPEWQKAIIRLTSQYYAASINYNTADERFDERVRPLLVNYAIDDCFDLIERIEGNDQTWGRGRARRDHREVQSRLLSLDPRADLAPYQNFTRYLE